MSIYGLLINENVPMEEDSLRNVAEAVRLGLLYGMSHTIAPDIVMDPQRFADTFWNGYRHERDNEAKVASGMRGVWYLRAITDRVCRGSFIEDCGVDTRLYETDELSNGCYRFFTGLEDWSGQGIDMSVVEEHCRVVKIPAFRNPNYLEPHWDVTYKVFGLPAHDDIESFLHAVYNDRGYMLVQAFLPGEENAAAFCGFASDLVDPFFGRGESLSYSSAFMHCWNSDECMMRWYHQHKSGLTWNPDCSVEEFISTIKAGMDEK